MNKVHLSGAFGLSLLFFVLLATLEVSRVDVGWASLVFACVGAALAVLGVRRNSAVDLILVVVATWVIGVQLLSLLIWPEFIAYQDAKFYLAQLSDATVRQSFSLLMVFASGWAAMALLDFQKIGRDTFSQAQQEDSVLAALSWLLASVLVIAALGAVLGVGVAGSKQEFRYEGIFYYVFPADYLAVALATGLGFGAGLFRRYRAVIWVVLGLYLVVKLSLGWKSPILNVALSFMVGGFYAERKVRPTRMIPIVMIVLLLYLFAIRPAAQFVRTGDLGGPRSEVVALKVDGLNPFAGRLTEGTLFATAAIESTAMRRVGVELVGLGKDFLNRLVPGTVWEIKSIDRVFTEDILGQPPNVPSTFAPGLIGMAEMLGGGGAAFLYGFAARAVIALILAATAVTRNVVMKFFFTGSVAIATVSVCIDGYFGGIERLGVATVVLFSAFFALRAGRNFADGLVRLHAGAQR